MDLFLIARFSFGRRQCHSVFGIPSRSILVLSCTSILRLRIVVTYIPDIQSSYTLQPFQSKWAPSTVMPLPDNYTLQPFQSKWAPSAVMPLHYQLTVHRMLSILFSCL